MFLHADGKDSDQTIWVFAGRTGHFVGFVMRQFICKCDTAHALQMILQQYYIVETPQNELIDPRVPENFIDNVLFVYHIYLRNFNFNTQERMKKQLYLSDSSNFLPLRGRNPAKGLTVMQAFTCIFYVYNAQKRRYTL